MPCKIENGATSDYPYRQEITAVEFVQYIEWTAKSSRMEYSAQNRVNILLVDNYSSADNIGDKCRLLKRHGDSKI